MKRAIITVGLGYGDESKGSWVDYLTRKYEAELVIRYSGGSQCGHNVELPDGTRHTFSQFGAGTFAGAKTLLGPQVIINPHALLRETEALNAKALGGYNALESLVIHPHCLVTTVFHQWMNQLKELSLGYNRHGSCGHGIGETRSYWLKYGNDAIFASDLSDMATLHSKLELMRQRYLIELEALSNKLYDLGDTLKQYNMYGLSAFNEATLLSAIGHMLRITYATPAFKTVIFEGAQGILLDEYYGFHPHTTWSTVTPHHALEMATNLNVKQCAMLGLTRSYMTRHGNGPFPTFNDELTLALGPTDRGNPPNDWQGIIRCGFLDIPLLKYSAEVCGGLDGLLISHLDQFDQVKKINTAYINAHGDRFHPTPSIIPNLQKQQGMNDLLYKQQYMDVGDVDVLLDIVKNEVVPNKIIGVANGPTHLQRNIPEFEFRVRV